VVPYTTLRVGWTHVFSKGDTADFDRLLWMKNVFFVDAKRVMKTVYSKHEE
jgi:hypothetical protein